jgi:glutaredoxin
MYALIGKEKCNQCNIWKNLLDEKGIQYHYVDVSKIPPELLTYLRMYCNTYPIVLGVKYFSTFNETLEHFKDI